MIFIAFIAVMLALCFLIVLFVLYRYASPVQDAQVRLFFFPCEMRHLSGCKSFTTSIYFV